MFYLITGAAAAGKSTLVHFLKEKLETIECHDFDEILVNTGEERCLVMEQWILKALEAQRKGKDFLITAHTPLGELLASPSAIKLDGICACLLDCNDFIRTERYRSRPDMEEWPLNQDTLCWAVWQRMHASDPQWEQRVILRPKLKDFKWERWINWTKNDKRWQLEILDNSNLTIDETLKILTEWISEQKDKNN